MTSASRTPEEFDPAQFDHEHPAFLADPYVVYTRMRLAEGGSCQRTPDGPRMFFRHADVARLLVDQRLSDLRATPLLPVQRRGEGGGPPMSYLSPGHLTPRVRTIVHERAARIPRTGTIDVMGDFADQLPAAIITGLLPDAGPLALELALWSEQVAGLLRPLPRPATDLAEQGAVLVDGLARVAADSEPDTLLAWLTRQEADGRSGSERAAAAQCLRLAVAVQQVRYLVGNAVQALGRHPVQLALLRSEPGLLPLAVEEFLRYDSPVQYTTRVANRSFDYQGWRIEAGQSVRLYTASAHRDPGHYPRPDELDVTRRNNRHLVFTGAHLGLYAAVTRVVCREAVAALLTELPAFTVLPAPGRRWDVAAGLYAVVELPVAIHQEPPHRRRSARLRSVGQSPRR